MAEPIRTRLPVEFNLQALLYLMAQQLCFADRADLAGAAQALASKLGPVKIRFDLLTVDVLCAACDTMRERGATEAVAALDQLVALLKEGKKRKILGGLSYNVTTIGEIYDAAEKLVKHAERQAGG